MFLTTIIFTISLAVTVTTNIVPTCVTPDPWKMDDCCFCNKPLNNGDPTVELRLKGSNGVNRASQQRGSIIRTVPGQHVHQICRRNFCEPSRIHVAKNKASTSIESGEGTSLRSLHPPFDFSKHCIFCGQPAKYDGRKRGFDVIPVRTKDFQQKVAKICEKRNDAWGHTVTGRLACVNDLHAADAVYHNQCSVNFRTEKQIPQVYSESSPKTTKLSKAGRPQQETRKNAFLSVTKFLEENDEEQTTVVELANKMQEYLHNTEEEAYSVKYMKAKLKEHFGDKIVFTELNGKSDVVTFRNTASCILYEFHKQQRSTTPDEEKVRIIEAAAKLIQSDVKAQKVSSDVYPTPSEMSSTTTALNFIPESLQVLLRTMFVGKNVDVKLASLGQAIMQAIRPRVLLAPLQLGLGIQMHHHFASRFLIDTLHAQSFSCSYSEVKKYERSAAVSQGTEIPSYASDQYIQYVADNVDHNIGTLDGSGTFHGMGIIATQTPGSKNSKIVPRVTVTAEDIAAVGRINIKYFKPSTSEEPLVYQPIMNFGVQDTTLNLDVLWKTSLLLRNPRPSWSGMMQMVNNGPHPGQSSTMFLPMIDMNPNDISCVYSTLCFVCDHAKQYNVTPVLTFDQPLWWKALMIIRDQPSNSDLKQVVVRLGGLHTEMSFIGSIGHLMTGSGLQELLEVVYASNSVTHMMSGKAIARAVRGHFLVDAALNTMLVADLYNIDLPTKEETQLPAVPPPIPITSEVEQHSENPSVMEEQSTEVMCTITSEEDQSSEVHGEVTYEQQQEVLEYKTQDADIGPSNEQQQCSEVSEGSQDVTMETDMAKAKRLYDRLISATALVDEICSADVMKRIFNNLKAKKEALTTRTAVLWMQYMEMIDILRKFLKAERTGNWELHLQAIHDMLPYFAASGHNLYAKSAYIYLQMMQSLPNTHPDVYRRFQEGYHVVRRSDRFWGGLSTDLIIEQVLMRNVKTSGGLTRGSGMSETQRNVWLLSMPCRAEVNDAMQDLTGVKYETSDQHKDMTKARQSRDVKDTIELLDYVRQHNPFSSDPTLRNIANGMTADKTVNADQAGEIGKKIIDTMEGKNVDHFSFKKADQAVTLGSRTSVKINNETVQVDPQLLFQRLVAVSRERVEGDLSSVFSYELCSYPPALFESSSLPLQADKPALADTLWKMVTQEQTKPSGDVHYILDGGALLHRIPWQRGSTYNGICQEYVNYVTAKYGRPTVVFDGYQDGPSTKDATHLRRTGTCPGLTVHFTGDMVIKSKKDEFLANEINKQRFINLLSDCLEKAGCDTFHATHDADVLIVTKAVESAKAINTILVGDDTDLLILLVYHAELNAKDIFFAPEHKANTKKKRLWNIKQLKETLGSSVCDKILFIHALLGCDTTSRIFGLGKGLGLKKIMKDGNFSELANIFCQTAAHPENIIKAGEKALICLYGGVQTESLDSLRYRRFCVKVSAVTSAVEPKTLPPTSAAVKYHSLRVYYQVQEWKGMANCLSPEDWGWQVRDGKYLPKQTDKPPAPQTLLEVIRCACKRECATRRCTCRKYGLQCSNACTDCRGTSCANSPTPDLELDQPTA